MLFSTVRAAVVVPDPQLRRRADPPAPEGDWVAVAEAGSCPAGPADPGLPAERRYPDKKAEWVWGVLGKGQTPSSRPGTSSTSSAAAPGALETHIAD